MRSRHHGFTLVELLLVLAIIAVVSAVVMPTFVRSLRGNRLRMAARTVVMAGRYARSMAVLRQQTMHLCYDLKEGTVAVQETDTPSSGTPSTPEPGTPSEREGTPPVATPWDVAVVRRLDRIRIERVERLDGDQVITEGMCRIPYFTQGTCPPYVVRLTDEHGEVVSIAVDALGAPEVRWERP